MSTLLNPGARTKMIFKRSALSAAVLLFLTNTVIGDVYSVTKENFQRYFKSKTGSIFLYVTRQNCEECELFYFKFVTVSQIFLKNRDASFGRVDDVVLAEAFGVKSYPDIVYYEKGSASPKIYGRDITPMELSKLVTNAMKVDPSTVHVKYTVGLTLSNFKQLMNTDKQHRLVLLHKNDDLVEYDDFDEIAEAFENELEIVLATINVDKQKQLQQTYLAKRYPVLYWYPLGSINDKKLYGGDIKVDQIVKFINKECGFFRTVDGSLNSLAGLINDLDIIIAEHAKDLYEISNLDFVRIKLRRAISQLAVESDMDLAEFYVHLVDEIEEDRTIDALDETRNRIFRQMLGAGPFQLDQLHKKKNIIHKFIKSIDDYLAKTDNSMKHKFAKNEDPEPEQASHNIEFHDEF